MEMLKNELTGTLLSIVTPMHNSFDMMKKNLEILESDDLNEFVELVIIDDCSTDCSYGKLEDYIKTSTLNIKIRRNDSNFGPGTTRNNGIMLATGKYLTFVDSDDYVSRDFLKEIFGIIEREKVDCIIFDYMLVDEKGNRLSGGKSIGNVKSERGLIDNKEALVYTYGSTCGKVYRKAIIDKYNIKFGDFWRNEDMPFTKYAIAMCETIYYLPSEIYNYVQIGNSLMHDKKLSNEKNCQKAFGMLQGNIKKYGFEEELFSIELREVLNNSVLIKINRGDPLKTVREYIKIYYRKEHLKNKYFKDYPVHVKIISYLAYYKQLTLLKMIGMYMRWRKRKNT